MNWLMILFRRDGAPPLLPLGAGRRARDLALMLAPVAFLAALALAAIGLTAGGPNRPGPPAMLTIVIPHEAEAGAAGQEARMVNVIAALTSAPGIARIRPLTAQESSALLEPWREAGADAPRLIDVELTEAGAADPAELQEALQAAAPGVAVEAGAIWQGYLNRLGDALHALALLALISVGAAAAAMIALATRAALGRHANSIRLMHQLGGEARAIIAAFRNHMALVALAGSAVGLVAGWVFMLVLALLGSVPGPLVSGTVGIWVWLLPLLVLPAWAAFGWLAATLIVRRALARLP